MCCDNFAPDNEVEPVLRYVCASIDVVSVLLRASLATSNTSSADKRLKNRTMTTERSHLLH